MDDLLRYPIGRFSFDPAAADTSRAQAIEQIAALAGELELALEGLNDAQMDTPYRPEGWTVRQLVHHMADSHMNAYIRCRWALTEDRPTIKGYNEKSWADLYDARTAPVSVSVALLSALHTRWVALLKNLRPEDFHRELVHPENGPGTLARYTALYAWHGKHHVAHISALRERMGW